MVEVVWSGLASSSHQSYDFNHYRGSTLPNHDTPAPHYLNHYSHSRSILPQPSPTIHTPQPSLVPHYLNHHSRYLQLSLTALHTTSTITHDPPHYLNHHSRSALLQPSLTFVTTSTITHLHATSISLTCNPSKLPQPLLTAPHRLNYHSQLHTTSTITH